MDTQVQEYRSDADDQEISAQSAIQLINDEYLEHVQRLKMEVADKSDECELLKIKLKESNQIAEELRLELNECKSIIFENNEDSKKFHEEALKSKTLEENYVKLMSDFLDLSEKTEQYKRSLFDDYLAKSNAINNVECMWSNKSNLLDKCLSDLDTRSAELKAASARLKAYEEENDANKLVISELRNMIEEAQATHKHEIIVLEEYIQSLKNTISSYEKTLTSFTAESKP